MLGVEDYGSYVEIENDRENYTSLLDTNLDWEDIKLGTIVEVLQNGKNIWWAAKFSQNFPRNIMVSVVKSFG